MYMHTLLLSVNIICSSNTNKGHTDVWQIQNSQPSQGEGIPIYKNVQLYIYIKTTLYTSETKPSDGESGLLELHSSINTRNLRVLFLKNVGCSSLVGI